MLDWHSCQICYPLEIFFFLFFFFCFVFFVFFFVVFFTAKQLLNLKFSQSDALIKFKSETLVHAGMLSCCHAANFTISSWMKIQTFSNTPRFVESGNLSFVFIISQSRPEDDMNVCVCKNYFSECLGRMRMNK